MFERKIGIVENREDKKGGQKEGEGEEECLPVFDFLAPL